MLGDDVAPHCSGLAKLVIVDVAHRRNHDNAQLTFESMNSTARELSPADWIRNSIPEGLEQAAQTRSTRTTGDR